MPCVLSRANCALRLAIGALVCCVSVGTARPAAPIDLDSVANMQDGQSASGELEEARRRAVRATAQAAAAREQLDAFLAQHFDTRLRLEPPTPVAQPAPNPTSARHADAELARLKTRLAELRSERLDLLGYLTDDHPQVTDIDERIVAVEVQVANVAGLNVTTLSDSGAAVEQRWSAFHEQLSERHRQHGVEYRRLYDLWRLAEMAAMDARQAEATLVARAAETERRPTASVDAGTTAAVGAETVSSADSGSSDDEAARTASQPLALAALLIALAVAAIAAVRLARSTADPLFASADEVAAALAIPVVGIIPAAATRVQQGGESSRRGSWVLALEIGLAVLVFAITVVAVQNAGAVWEACAHPADTLDALLRTLTDRD